MNTPATEPCSLCEGKRKVQRRGYTTRCERCDEREIKSLRDERDAMRKILVAARNFVHNGGDITALVDAVVDFDMGVK